MMISNSPVELDSGQMFWNQSCLERSARWPGFYAEVTLPCRHSRQPHWADPVVVMGITSEQPQHHHPPVQLLSYSIPKTLLNVTWTAPRQEESLRWDCTLTRECNPFLFFFNKVNNPTHLLGMQCQKHVHFLTFKCDLSLKPQCTLSLT